MAKEQRQEFSNQEEYPLLREFLTLLVRANPYSRYGVHAVGIGDKVIARKPANRLALRFYVARKLPLSQVPREQRIPASFQTFSYEYNRDVELVTDVIESPPAGLLGSLIQSRRFVRSREALAAPPSITGH